MLTTVDDLLAVEVGQPPENAFGHLAEDLLARASAELLDLLVDAVQTAALAVFHRYRDGAGGMVDKSPVVATDVLRGTVPIEVEFSHDLLLHVGIRVGRDDLTT